MGLGEWYVFFFFFFFFDGTNKLPTDTYTHNNIRGNNNTRGGRAWPRPSIVILFV